MRDLAPLKYFHERISPPEMSKKALSPPPPVLYTQLNNALHMYFPRQTGSFKYIIHRLVWCKKKPWRTFRGFSGAPRGYNYESII